MRISDLRIELASKRRVYFDIILKHGSDETFF